MAWFVGVIISFLVTFFLAPLLSKQMIKHGIVGRDVHKHDKPVCAEMGGLAVLLGFVTAFLCAFLLFEPTRSLIGVFLTIVFVGVIGVIDDLFTLRQRYKPILVAFASMPLISSLHCTEVWFLFLGYFEFGFYYFFLIALGVATASNLTNMLAGFNGLEAGIGAIACVFLGLLCIFHRMWELALVALSLGAAFTAFLKYNWYPAKIFPGDTGTLISGASIAAISIFGHFEFMGMVTLAPAAIDFTLKMISRTPFSHRRLHGDTLVDKNGILTPPDYPSLPHAFMKVAKLDEKNLVRMLLFMETLYCVLGLLLTMLLKR